MGGWMGGWMDAHVTTHAHVPKPSRTGGGGGEKYKKRPSRREGEEETAAAHTCGWSRTECLAILWHMKEMEEGGKRRGRGETGRVPVRGAPRNPNGRESNTASRAYKCNY